MDFLAVSRRISLGSLDMIIGINILYRTALMRFQLTPKRAHGHLFYRKHSIPQVVGFTKFRLCGGDSLLGFPKSFVQNCNSSVIICTGQCLLFNCSAACPSSNKQRKIRCLERDLNSHLRVCRPPFYKLSYRANWDW